MRRAWILPALALACSRENPGFMLATAGALETGTSAAATGTSGPDATSTTSTTTDPQTTGPATTSEPPLPICPQWAESTLNLSFKYKGEPLVPAADCPTEIFSGKGLLSNTSVTLIPDMECQGSVTDTFELMVGGFKLPPYFASCMTIAVAWNSDCTAVRGALLSAYFEGLPEVPIHLAAAALASALAPPGVPPELVPELLLDEACTCDPKTDNCCPTADPGPGAYQLNFAAAGVLLGPGDSTPDSKPITTEMGDFAVTNLRTHVHADCVDSPVHVDWYAVRQ